MQYLNFTLNHHPNLTNVIFKSSFPLSGKAAPSSHEGNVLVMSGSICGYDKMSNPRQQTTYPKRLLVLTFKVGTCCHCGGFHLLPPPITSWSVTLCGANPGATPVFYCLSGILLTLQIKAKLAVYNVSN